MKKVTPCLLFNGQAEEAARFYVSLLPDSQIDRVSSWPNDPGEVLVVNFTLAGVEFVALNGPKSEFTEAVSFQLACADQAEVDRLWAGLTDGGSGGPCGWVKDRWGMSWQIAPTRVLELITDSDPNRAQRAMEAMMKMGKIDIAEVEKASDGA